jgi:Uma2 family endonuclease
MSLPKRDSDYHTFRDYLLWSRNSGDELIDGVAYVKEPPSPTWSHQSIAFQLCHQIENKRKGASWRVFMAPFDVRLPKSDECDDQIDTVVQPDVLIVCDPNKLSERGVRGAPDWIAEVLSPSTARYDQTQKIPVYERAGVREVWLIRPGDRRVSIYRLAEGRYGQPTTLELKGRTPLTAVPGLAINWTPVIRELPPAAMTDE